MRSIILSIIAVIIYICIDFIYIFLAKSRYDSAVQTIQGSKMEIDAGAAVVCYIIMAIGWFFIPVQMAISYYNKLKQRSPDWTPLISSALSGLVAGSLYGFVVYGVYNLTTRALFSSRYPVSLVIQDTAWGTFYNAVYTCIYMMIWSKVTDPTSL